MKSQEMVKPSRKALPFANEEVGEKSGWDKIEAVPDRVIVLKNAGAATQSADEANFRIRSPA